MNLLTTGMNTLKKMNILDIGIFKLYLFMSAMTLASYVDRFESLDPLIYLILGVLGSTYLIRKYYSKTPSDLGYLASKVASFRQLTLLDASIFKLALVCIGFAAYYLILWFQTVDIHRYASIFVFCMGRILSLRSREG